MQQVNVTTCEPLSYDTAAGDMPEASRKPAREVCKPGAHFPESTAVPNVLLIGDSVASGYQSFVRDELTGVAQVQLSPWLFSENPVDGAGEPGYFAMCAQPSCPQAALAARATHCSAQRGLGRSGRCSEYMLRAPDGTPLRPDVVWFNFGFHSLNENAVRPEYGLRNYESVYEADLDRVTSVLANWSRDPRHGDSPPTLIFGLTTPMLFSVHADDVIRRHNVRLAPPETWPCRPPSCACLSAPHSRRVTAGPSPRHHEQVWGRHGGHARANSNAGSHRRWARHHTSRHVLAWPHTPHPPTHPPSRNAPWQCGEPLQRQGCFGDPECWAPHCAPDGYAWLARTVIAPAIRRALQIRTGARNARRTRDTRVVIQPGRS